MKVNIAIVVLSLLMLVVVLNIPFKTKRFGDSFFHREAKNLVHNIKGSPEAYDVIITRAPGPVLFYTVPYTFLSVDASDSSYWNVAVVFNFLAIVVSLIFFYKAVVLLFSKPIAVLGLLMFFLFPIQYYYALGITGEIPAFLALSIAVYSWVLILKDKSKKIGAITFVLSLWFLTMCRPNTILLVPIGFAVFGYAFFFKKEFFKKRGILFMLLLIVTGMASFASLKGLKSFSDQSFTFKQQELFYYVALQGRYQFREEPFDLRYWESDIRPDSKDHVNWTKQRFLLNDKIKKSNKDFTEVYREFLIDDLIEHPFMFVRQFFIKCFYGHIYLVNSVQPKEFDFLFFKGRSGYFMVMLIINLINILIMAGLILFLFCQDHLIKFWLLWAIILGLLIFHGITYMEPRYLFPSRITLYIMSAVGLYKLNTIRRLTDWLIIKLRI